MHKYNNRKQSHQGTAEGEQQQGLASRESQQEGGDGGAEGEGEEEEEEGEEGEEEEEEDGAQDEEVLAAKKAEAELQVGGMCVRGFGYGCLLRV